MGCLALCFDGPGVGQSVSPGPAGPHTDSRVLRGQPQSLLGTTQTHFSFWDYNLLSF